MRSDWADGVEVATAAAAATGGEDLIVGREGEAFGSC